MFIDQYKNLEAELKQFVESNTGVDPSNRMELQIVTICMELMVLSACLWTDGTKERVYTDKIGEVGDVLWKYIRDEISAIYRFELEDASEEIEMLMEILFGKDCCNFVMMSYQFQYFQQKTDLDTEDLICDVIYVAKKAGECVQILEEDGYHEAASRVANHLFTFRFGQCSEEDAQIGRNAALFSVVENYGVLCDCEWAYSILTDFEKQLAEYNFRKYVRMCHAVSELFAEEGLEKAIVLNEKAMHYMEEDLKAFSEADIWGIRYNCILFHCVQCYSAEWLELMAELSDILRELESEEEEEFIRILEIKAAGTVLYHAAENQRLSDYFYLVQRFYDLTLQYDEFMRELPLYNHKMALHYRGLLYAEQGRYMAAEGCFKEAQCMQKNEMDGEIDFYLKINLCAMLLTQGNAAQAESIAEELFERIKRRNYPEEVGQKNIQRCIITISDAFEAAAKPHQAWAVIQEALVQGIVYFTEDSKSIVFVYAAFIVKAIRVRKNLSLLEITTCMEMIKQVELSSFFADLKSVELALHDSAKALLFWQKGDWFVLEETAVRFEDYRKGIRIWEQESFLTSCHHMLALAAELNLPKEAVHFIELMQKIMDDTLGKALVYQNRKRLSAFVSNASAFFYSAYSVLKKYACAEIQYQLVLNYKDVLALVTAAQRQLSGHNSKDSELAKEINQLYDQLADSNMNQMIEMDSKKEKLEAKLQEKEYQFAQTEERTYQHRPFKVEEVYDKLPDSSVFLEFVLYYEGFYRKVFDANFVTEERLSEAAEIDIFCITKVNGNCRIEKYKVSDTDELMRNLLTYQNEMGKKIHKKLIKMRRILYELLIGPIEKKLGGLKNLYIAPDEPLLNFPFEILTDKEGRMLGDYFTITLVNTGRDFIRSGMDTWGSGFVAVGNPAYDYLDQEKKKGFLRKILLRKEIKELPFSELEVRAICTRYGAEPLTGNNANKKVADQFCNAKWIHLATHGIYDEDIITDGWYSSALLFAGSENWRKTGTVHPLYGNGLLTADEIDRMDLSSVEMVVLSACYSGRIQFGDLAGIRSAFRNAGVKYVVASLWEVNDLAAALFMIRFYDYLNEYSVPEALKKAKWYIRAVTVREVEQEVELCLSKYYIGKDSEIRKELEKIDQYYAQDAPLFSDPYYWSSFVCIQNFF